MDTDRSLFYVFVDRNEVEQKDLALKRIRNDSSLLKAGKESQLLQHNLIPTRAFYVFFVLLSSATFYNYIADIVQSKGSWSQLINVMAQVCVGFLNIGTVEFDLCELSRLIE